MVDITYHRWGNFTHKEKKLIMEKVIIVDDYGNIVNDYKSNEDKNLQSQIDKEKKANLREHLYMGYLIIGTIAFTLGILISIRRLKNSK